MFHDGMDKEIYFNLAEPLVQLFFLRVLILLTIIFLPPKKPPSTPKAFYVPV